MPDRPAPSLTTSGAAAIRVLDADDRELLRELHGHGDNAIIAGGVEADRPEFVAAIRAERWSTPMVLLDGGEAVAAAMIVAADTQHRHGRVLVLTRDPGRTQAPLALYLRHAFWSHPLNRLYTALPNRVAEAHGYAELFNATGFVSEGRLVGHLRVRMRLVDVDLFGLLRSEFDAWSRARQPTLVLA
jgi:hypothetical protein